MGSSDSECSSDSGSNSRMHLVAGVGVDETTPLPLPGDVVDALALPVDFGILGLAGAGADEAAPLLLVPGPLLPAGCFGNGCVEVVSTSS